MAYGIQIGVPVIHGLYGAIFFGLVYAVRGKTLTTRILYLYVYHGYGCGQCPYFSTTIDRSTH